MDDLRSLRRDCHYKRSEYQHAREFYLTAMDIDLREVGSRVRLDPAEHDCSALRRELGEAILAYYAAHSALHSAMRERSPRLH